MGIDVRPVAHVLGLMLVALGVAMLFPATLDLAAASGNAMAFVVSAAVTALFGGLVALASAGGRQRMDLRQAFLVTVAAWLVLGFFGALPFVIGAPRLGWTDAIFEAVSGITTTGASVITGLDTLPPGMNLWRGMLNWIGGLGVAFVAMIFLPAMRVGGMQLFRAQGFDTMGKILPGAADIARSLLGVYVGLSVLCMLAYLAIGMVPLDAVVYAMATLATGGFASSDASFGKYPGAGEWVGSLFLVLSALPYIRYVQLVAGSPRALWRDPQVQVLLALLLVATGSVTLWRVAETGAAVVPAFREALFNIASVLTTAGFGSGTFTTWGPFALYVLFLVGMVGGCSGSSTAALSIFRVILIFKAVRRAVLRILAPDRVLPIRYAGQPVDAETLDSTIVFVNAYFLLFGALSVAVTLAGVDAQSALYGVWMAIGNIGYGIGPMVARTATFVDFPDAAKWLLILAMLLGRIGILGFFVVVLPRFWRA